MGPPPLALASPPPCYQQDIYIGRQQSYCNTKPTGFLILYAESFKELVVASSGWLGTFGSPLQPEKKKQKQKRKGEQRLKTALQPHSEGIQTVQEAASE